MSTVTTTYKTSLGAMEKLSSKQITLSKNTVKTSESFKKYNAVVDGTQKQMIRVSGAFTDFKTNQVETGKSLSQLTKSFTQSAVGSKLAMVGTSLLNGALIGLASWGIGKAIKAFDNYINRHEIAAKKARENIDVINGDIQGYQSQKKSLEEISKEYDELAKKTNKSADEIERFSQLKNEIAQIAPELVLGYDENNDPILAMKGNVTDLIGELDRAIESKQKLLESKEKDLGINATENIKEVITELNQNYKQLQTSLTTSDVSINNALKLNNFWGEVDIKKRTEKVAKALEEEERVYTEKYNKHLENLQEYKDREQEIQKTNLNTLFKSDNYKS